jgi:hypothetical protein
MEALGEREIGKLLGGRGQPNTGRPSPDVLSPRWACEVKLRSRLPLWLERVLHQAMEGATMGRLPLVVIVCPQGRGKKARRYAFLPLEALVSWGRESDDKKEVRSHEPGGGAAG